MVVCVILNEAGKYSCGKPCEETMYQSQTCFIHCFLLCLNKVLIVVFLQNNGSDEQYCFQKLLKIVQLNVE